MISWPLLQREVRAVVRLATPVAMVQIGFMLMGTVDAMMLGRHSELALAAGALGSSVSIGLICLPMGILMALDPLIAQAYGAGRHRRLGEHFKRGLILAAILTVPISLIMASTHDALVLSGQQPEIAVEAATYLRILALGNFAFLVFVVFRHTLQAMSQVRQAMIATAVANIVNVIVNYALIYGNFGFPALGVAGSAWATVISRSVMLAMIVAIGWPALRRYLRGSWRRALVLGEIWSAFRLGLPIGIQISFEMWLFMTVAVMMGSLGARELAAHQIALNLAALAFMVPLGISGAASTRVGNAIGRGDADGARRSALVCLVFGAAVMALAALAFVIFPGPLSRLYTPDAEIIALSMVLLPIAAAFQISDGLQVVAAGVLRGAADTRVAAVIAFVGYWVVGLPLAAFLAFRLDLGPRGLWWGLTLALSIAATLLILRVRARLRSPLLARLDDEHEAEPS